MRSIRYSRSFFEELATLLEQGVDRFGTRVVSEKRARVLDAVTRHLVHFPERPIDPAIGICSRVVARTPFILLYDFDDDELRVHLIIHAHSDRATVDLSAVEW